MIRVKRVYDSYDHSDGARFLVDRLWPRGLKKEALHLEGWFKDVAPSNELRHWFRHDPAKWEQFLQRYWAELDAHPQHWQLLLEAARRGTITLLYSSREAEHNNAVALRVFLERQLAETGR